MIDSEWNPGIFNPFEKLIEITVCGVRFSVPENNNLLRGFQYARAGALLRGNYCWAGDCTNCIVWMNNKDGSSKSLACRTEARPGMVISALSDDLRCDLRLSEGDR